MNTNTFKVQRPGISSRSQCGAATLDRGRVKHSRRSRVQTHRCQAQGNNTFDQFIQWGVGLLKKTLGPGQQRQQDEVPEDRALQQAHPEPEEPSRPAESVGSSGEPSASRPEGEGQSEASALTAQMEERISEYRHMVMTGKEITEDWPPPGTPTWSDWLSALGVTQTQENAARELEEDMETAVAKEDYSAAAKARAELDSMYAMDTVAGLVNAYDAALESEDFQEAARLRDEGAVGMRGWWYMQSSSVDNPPHLLRIRQAIDRYVLLAYSPQDIATIHGIAAPTTNFMERADSGYIPHPGSRAYDEVCTPVAELNFKRFPQIQTDSPEGDSKLWSLACAFADADSEEVLEVISEEQPESGDAEDLAEILAHEAVEVSTDESEGDSDTEIIAQEVFEVEADGQIRLVTDMPLSGEAEGIDGLNILSSSEVVEIPDYPPARHDLQRVPAHITRFDNDRDRFLLTVAPTNSDVEEKEEIEASSSGSDSDSKDSATGLEIVPVDPDEILLKKDLMEKMNAMLANKKPSDSGGDVKIMAFKLSVKSEKFKKQIEELAKQIKNIRNTGRTDEAASVLRNILESMQLIKETSESREEEGYGIKGTSCYKRLDIEQTTDPFSGLFVGTFGSHGPEILQLQRTIGEDKKAYVECTKLTGDSNVPAGHVAFKAAIGPGESTSGYAMYPRELGIRTAYKGKGRVAKSNYTEPRWVEGSLLQFHSRNPFSQDAELGFIYDMGGDNKLLIFLHRICLDDPTNMDG